MLYTATIWINDGPDQFFEDDPANGHFVEGEFLVAGETPEAALEAVFYVGNKMGDDLAGRAYPRTERSLSVGDAVLIREANDAIEPIERWAVAPFGFTKAVSA